MIGERRCALTRLRDARQYRAGGDRRDRARSGQCYSIGTRNSVLLSPLVSVALSSLLECKMQGCAPWSHDSRPAPVLASRSRTRASHLMRAILVPLTIHVSTACQQSLMPSTTIMVCVCTASGARCPSLALGCHRCCALAVHIGRLYRSRHRAERNRTSQDALVALTALDALL